MFESADFTEVKELLTAVSSFRAVDIKKVLKDAGQPAGRERQKSLLYLETYIKETAKNVNFFPEKWESLRKSILELFWKRIYVVNKNVIIRGRTKVTSNKGFNPRIISVPEDTAELKKNNYNYNVSTLDGIEIEFSPSVFHDYGTSLTGQRLWRVGPLHSEFCIEMNLKKFVVESIHGMKLPKFQLLYYMGVYNMSNVKKCIDIKYPTHLDLIIYGKSISLKKYFGIKGKPWSAQPVDIGSYINNRPGKHKIKLIAQNDVSCTYVLDFRFVKYIPTDNIVKKIQEQMFVTKEVVIKNSLNSNISQDVVSTTNIVPLTDITTLKRIDIPAKSTTCSHAQCFDCATFFELNRTIPTWMCPLCDKRIDPKDIFIDGLFAEILMLTSADITMVQLEEDFNWTIPKNSPSKKNDTKSENNTTGPKNSQSPLDNNKDVGFIDLTISDDDDIAAVSALESMRNYPHELISDSINNSPDPEKANQPLVNPRESLEFNSISSSYSFMDKEFDLESVLNSLIESENSALLRQKTNIGSQL